MDRQTMSRKYGGSATTTTTTAATKSHKKKHRSSTKSLLLAQSSMKIANAWITAALTTRTHAIQMVTEINDYLMQAKEAYQNNDTVLMKELLVAAADARKEMMDSVQNTRETSRKAEEQIKQAEQNLSMMK